MNSNQNLNPVVSVIVPIFNAELWLQDSLESIQNQTLKDIEIICIDDGSSDKSAEVVLCHQKVDPRIRLIEQENSGAAIARNKGLECAKGKYVIFLDADDLYGRDMLRAMSGVLDESGADLCICEAVGFNSSGAQWQYITFDKSLKNGVNNTADLQSILFQMSVVPWNKMLRRSYVIKHSLRFQDLPCANDVYFSCCALCQSESIYAIRESYVEHRCDIDSSLQGRRRNAPLCGIEAWRAVHSDQVVLRSLSQQGVNSLEEACLSSLWDTFRRFANDIQISKSVYDLYSEHLKDEWHLVEKTTSDFSTLNTKFKFWCIRRLSFRGMRWACCPVGNGEKSISKTHKLALAIRLGIAAIIRL